MAITSCHFVVIVTCLQPAFVFGHEEETEFLTVNIKKRESDLIKPGKMNCNMKYL